MSLINEALKRARTDAERQAEAERGGSAPAPAWTPPPFSRRERSPVATSLVASLGVSLAVALGLYFFLHRDAQARSAPASSAAAPTATAAPAPPSAAPPATQPAPVPTAAVTAAPVATASSAPNAPARHVATPSAGAPEAPAVVERAPRQASAPGMTDETPRASARPASAPIDPAPTVAEQRTATREKVAPTRTATASAGEGRTVTAEVTLPSGAKVTLDGIISGAIPLAMLNGHMIGIGEFAGDCAVMKIEARRVQLRCPSGLLWIALP